jgi:magnesium-transporting ATPase (P-type)
MVTGDNKLTAYAIAKECGIIEADDKTSIVIEGPDFMDKIGGIVIFFYIIFRFARSVKQSFATVQETENLLKK